MHPEQYSVEQQKDIEKRVEKAKNMLKELGLQPAVIMQPVNVGDDVFGIKPIPFLQDIKYQNVISPLSPK